MVRFNPQGLAQRFSSLVDVLPEVQNALKERRPVVALESTIMTHGMPWPTNYETARAVESIVRQQGAVPATIAIYNGRVKVGLDDSIMRELAQPSAKVVKTSRRDFSYVTSQGLCGGTTVSGTIFVANMLGIKIIVTGGIGGVHRMGETTMDISADLTELGRTNIMVVSSGIKSILDIGRTLEFLETQGVSVVSYGQSQDFPAFYSRESGFKAPYNIDCPKEAAKMMFSSEDLQLDSGILMAVPVPEKHSLDNKEMENTIEAALKEAKDNNIVGRDVTPFILGKVASLTHGTSLETNVALIQHNALIGSQIACELEKLHKESGYILKAASTVSAASSVSAGSSQPVVIGASIMDCIISLLTDIKMDGRTLAGRIAQGAGGVGRNVADALGKISSTTISLVSSVGNDQYGKFLLNSIRHLDTSTTKIDPNARTASYSLIVDKTGEARFGVGDMDIHSKINRDMVIEYSNVIKRSPIVIMDGNIPYETIEFVLELGGNRGLPIWFEPTDIIKSAKPMNSVLWKNLSFVSPNLNELKEMSKKLGGEVPCDLKLENSTEFFQKVKVLAEPLTQHIPLVMVTLGKLGILLISRLPIDVPVKEGLSKPLERSEARYYPAEEVEGIVNVSGAGDCSVAGFVTGFLNGLTEGECVFLSNAAALGALRSISAVPDTFEMPSSMTKKEFKIIY